MGRLRNLKKLEFGENRFWGTIPSSIFNLSSIEVFDVIMNQIQGSLPSSLGITLPNLQIFGVGINLLTGSIPISISNATKLHQLAFSANSFTGKVPPLEKLRDLEKLGFFQNHLGTGEADDLCFVDSLVNATNLYLLNLSENHFGGLLPKSISNFSTDLFILNLHSNKIVGSIPTGLGSLVNLQALDLSNNLLTRNIPADIGKLQRPQLLFLGDNKFYGEIPSSFGNLTSLTVLS